MPAQRLITFWALLLSASILAIGCSPELHITKTGLTTTERFNETSDRLYVVSMFVETRRGHKNELVTLDPESYETINRSDLVYGTLVFKFSQDPQGRIWTGYSGTPENYNTKRVDIFDHNGSHVKTLEPCSWPDKEITFAAGWAFIPCYLNGFHARMVVVDLSSLEIVKTIELEAEPRFSLLAAAATEETVLVAGGSDTHGTLVMIDPHSMEISQTIDVYGGISVRTIVVHDGLFYMLNRGSHRSPENPLDLHIVTPGDSPTVTSHQLAARSPVFGFIEGDQLWAYHDPAISGDSGSRAISRYDLLTGETELWPLPDYWWAGDMAWIDGKIILTRRHSLNPDETDGLYEFNPETGELIQWLELEGAQLLLVPDE
ncbi:MAG: hypothetical protein KDD92_07520 [Caldilineaceae bacterium]|nr:hypothetical protein [Caldilineaceae bacterium]